MDLIHQSKDTEWLEGLKNKTQLYAASRRLSSKVKHRFNGKRWKMILQANDCQEKASVAIFISE